MRRTLLFGVLFVTTTATLGAAAAPVTAPGMHEEPDWDRFLQAYAALGRADLSDIDPVLHAVPVAPGGGFAFTLEWTTGNVLPAAPVSAAWGPAAGCVTPGPGALVPWARADEVVGPCPHPGILHEGGLTHTTMMCAGVGGYCMTDGVDERFGFFVLVCDVSQVVLADWSTGAAGSVPVGALCGLFGGGLLPTQWTAWDSICGHAVDAQGPFACAHSRTP